MLYFGNSSRDTRWIPFPVEEISLENGKAKLLREIDPFDTSDVESYGAEAFMAGLVDEKEKVVGWARDKYVLFVGKHLDWDLFPDKQILRELTRLINASDSR